MPGSAKITNRVVHVVDSDSRHLREVSKALQLQGITVYPFSSDDYFRDAILYLPAGCTLLVARERNDEITTRIRNFSIVRSDFSIIVMGEAPAVADVVRALKGGAADFLPIPWNAQSLKIALDAAFEHLPRKIARRRMIGEALELKNQLTRREEEVLEAVVSGMTNREIATKLSIGVRTVEMHRGNIMHKLRMDNLASLMRFAFLTGIIDPGQITA